MHDDGTSDRVARPQGRFTQHRRMSELRRLLHLHPSGVTLLEIAAHLRVTPRSARRYLRELSYDLEAVPERPGGQKRWRIPAVDLPRRVAVRRTQAYALLAARGLFDSMRGSTLYEEIDLAVQTLLGVARRPGRGPNSGVADAQLEQRFRYLPFAPKDYSHKSEDLDSLFQAVADLRPVSCRYPRHDDGALERIMVHPYALLLYKDAIYCLAHDTRAAAVRPLALDGIVEARCHDDERFALPQDFRIDDYVQGQFGIWAGAAAARRVIIEFDAEVRDYLTTRVVHRSQRLEMLPGDRVRLQLELADLREVATWVLGFGKSALVIEPMELRDQVRRELSAALSRYM